MDVSDIKPQYLALSDDMANFLDKVAKTYNKDNKVTKIDVLDYYNKEFRNSPNESCYCSPYTLLRLFADIIPNMPDKLLYLDCDLMFNGDIEKLWNIDIEKYEYAAANDHYGKFLINPRYINAGVLLFNMKKMRETNLLGKARELIRLKKLTFADQSAIIRSTTKKKLISQRFNDQKFLYKKTIIRHFSKRLFYRPYPHTDNIKQWNVEKVHKVFKYHQFDDIYEKYFKLKEEFEKEK
jgi:lipopolysaccharide biosynthesis glycosyltransferase